MLANKRGSSSLILDDRGNLAGILTDTDVTRRVVAKELDTSASVSKVMTSNPTVVAMSDPAMDALTTMVENHFRHLPVVDDHGAVVGVLDIAKCLNDAISKLEKAEQKSSSAAEDAVKQMAALQGAGGQQAAMLTQLLGPLMAQAFGNKASPTLRSLLAGKPSTIVSPETSLLETAVVMSDARKAALVVDKGKLVGIFGFKDMMTRAVAKELDLEHTAVQTVMTPDPEAVSPDMTVIEALTVMHDNKFLNLPVCESDGRVCGLVGVMDLIHGCGGAEGWRSLFDRTMGMDGRDASETGSHHSGRPSHEPAIRAVSSPYATAVLNKVPNQILFNEGDEDTISASLLDRTFSFPHTPDRLQSECEFVFKVFDSEGNKYLIRNDGSYSSLLKALQEKIDGNIDAKSIELKFVDEEGDQIKIRSDDCLQEAITSARKAGVQGGMKLMLSINSSKGLSPVALAAAGGGVVLAIAVAALVLLKPK
jgi:CBS domain-containing protein